MIRKLLALSLVLTATPVVAQSATDVVVMRRPVAPPKQSPKAPVAPSGLVTNGGLDTLTGWSTVRSATAVSNLGRSGGTSARLAYGNGAIYQTIKTIPGRTYTATAYFRSVTNGGAAMIQLGNGAGEFVGPYNYRDMSGVTTWTPLSISFTATQTSTYLLIEIVNHVSQGDVIAVDDVSAVEQ
jgi:hypothetical protein